MERGHIDVINQFSFATVDYKIIKDYKPYIVLNSGVKSDEGLISDYYLFENNIDSLEDRPQNGQPSLFYSTEECVQKF